MRHPELPTSTIVVTPERKLNPSGSTLLSPAHASRIPVVAKRCTWPSIRSRGDVQAGDVDHRAGLRGIDAGSHGGDLPVGDRDVHDRIDVVARVDDVSSLEQDFVTRLSVDGRDHDEKEEQRERESEERVNKEEQRKPESGERVQHALIVLENRGMRCVSCSTQSGNILSAQLTPLTRRSALDASSVLTAVPVSTSEPTISIGSPAKVFDTKYAEPNPSRHYDVSADGQRFLVLKASATGDPNAAPVSMVLVEHWFEELKQRVNEK